MTPEELERLCEEVQSLHQRRLDLPLGDLVPRRFKRRPRPRTEIIATAAIKVTQRRDLIAKLMGEWRVHTVPTDKTVNTLESA
jgi:hypothetical protein